MHVPRDQILNSNDKDSDKDLSLQRQISWQGGVSPKEPDKVAQNINTFTPSPSSGYDIYAYLWDTDFHLQRHEHATAQDQVYLISGTAGQEVHSFLKWQKGQSWPQAAKWGSDQTIF